MHNNSLDDRGVQVMLDIFPKITKLLEVGDAFLDGNGCRRNVNDAERAVLQEGLNKQKLVSCKKW